MNDLERSLAFVPNEAEIKIVQGLELEQLPKISVVIPSLNQARFLAETLESVLSQNYPRLEVFVADGGSTDGSSRLLEEYAAKHSNTVRYISESDKGQYHAVNKAIDSTDGEIISWVNSDDIYLPNTFWKVVTFFHFNRCALVVYGRNRYTDENLVPRMDYPVDWSPLLQEQRRRMMHFCLPPQPSLFFRRIAIVLLGKLNSPILDYEMWLRWQRNLQFYFIDDYLSLSRLHDEAKTVRDHQKLIHQICKVVHRYYMTVPSSWTRTRAYHEKYGALWVSGRIGPITNGIRFKGALYWFRYNVIWAPRSLYRGLSYFARFLKESWRGHL